MLQVFYPTGNGLTPQQPSESKIFQDPAEQCGVKMEV